MSLPLQHRHRRVCVPRAVCFSSSCSEKEKRQTWVREPPVLDSLFPFISGYFWACIRGPCRFQQDIRLLRRFDSERSVAFRSQTRVRSCQRECTIWGSESALSLTGIGKVRNLSPTRPPLNIKRHPRSRKINDRQPVERCQSCLLSLKILAVVISTIWRDRKSKRERENIQK